MNPTVVQSVHSNVGIITIDYPPVNALSQSVRQGLLDAIVQFENNDDIAAIIVRCLGKTFIAGADIKEFGTAPLEPHLPDVVNRIEACKKPVIASLFGTSLGGGFEVALACHYRVAISGAKVGLPEVNLGLIPGAGGTQRLPRIVGCKKAIEMITSGKHYSVDSLAETDLIDALFDANADLQTQSIDWVTSRLAANTLPCKAIGNLAVIDDISNWQESINLVAKKARGKEAPVVAAQVIQKTTEKNILDGMQVEREAFIQLRDSEQSAALRYVFSSERKAAKTAIKAEAYDVKNVGVIGGGTMGSGIATAFLTSGFNVVLLEQNDAALQAGFEKIKRNFVSNIKRGRMTQANVDAYLTNLSKGIDYQLLDNVDLVVEAVFENMQVKKEIFQKLGDICRPDCVLATNTSYLDINEIAATANDPSQVIGMHFFSPANIMKLLEVVQANESSDRALVTAMAVAKKLKKISVLVKVCFGFAGNRMYTRYGREVQQMLLEGATVSQIDKALTDWGMAMGPLAVADMSGIDIGVHARRSQPFPDYDKGYFKPSEAMFDLGRFGRKTGSGYYLYDEQGKPKADDEVAKIIKSIANDLSIQQKQFSSDEIVERSLMALVSEGLQLLEEGIVQQLLDIDVIWLHGYGFPRHKGGPMFQAQQMGATKVQELINKYRESEGEKIWPKLDLNLLND